MIRRGEREHRYLVSRDEAESFVAAISERAQLEVYDAQRPIAYSRTTYLDTADFAYYRSCAGSVVRRARLREYAAAEDTSTPAQLTGACFLEYKENIGAARSKVRVLVPREVIASLLRGGAVDSHWWRRFVESPPLYDIARRLHTGQLAPRLTTWYRRASLVRDRVRITLDEGVALCSPVDLATSDGPVEPPEVARYVPGRILEIKVWGEDPPWLQRAMEPLARPSNFSKFQAGMLAIQRSRRVPLNRTEPLSVLAPMRIRSADDQG